jgi:hypothetical protein
MRTEQRTTKQNERICEGIWGRGKKRGKAEDWKKAERESRDDSENRENSIDCESDTD